MFEPSHHQQVAMTPEPAAETNLNNQFFACYEDSSFIYRHRKRPRSSDSPFESSPASSTTTTDSMLTNSLNFSDSSRSSVARGNGGRELVSSFSSASASSSRSSKCLSLSPPPLTFNLLSATYSPGQLAPLGAKVAKRALGRAERRAVECREAFTIGNDENQPRHQAELAGRVQITTKTSSRIESRSILDVQQQQQVDEKIYQNLILRERRFEEKRTALGAKDNRPVLCGQLRHSLLSWMLRICEFQQCQDEIFPLASIILDSFLRINPVISTTQPQDSVKQGDTQHHLISTHHKHLDHRCHQAHHHPHNHSRRQRRQRRLHRRTSGERQQCRDELASESSGDDDDGHSQHLRVLESAERELEQRQLLLFAACSLLLATKLRQTPRLYIQTLIEFSKFELPLELGRDEIINGELLMLSLLKWDLAALVTPNEFLQELLARKCHSILGNFLAENTCSSAHEGNDGNGAKLRVQVGGDDQIGAGVKDQVHCLDGRKQSELVDRVNRHTQTLLELCLMGKSNGIGVVTVCCCPGAGVSICQLICVLECECDGTRAFSCESSACPCWTERANALAISHSVDECCFQLVPAYAANCQRRWCESGRVPQQ